MSLDQDKNRHYSLRKLSVGLASVLIGISFVSAKGQVVKADNVKDNAKSAINEQALKPEKQDMQSSILKGTSEPAKQNDKNVDMAGKFRNTPPVQTSVNKENHSENSNSNLNSNNASSLNKNMQTVQNNVPRENRVKVTSGQTATTQPTNTQNQTATTQSTNTQDQTVITQPQKKQQASSDQNSVADQSQKNLMDDLGKQKTFTQAGNQVEDNVQTQLQNSQKLDLTKNRQLAKKVLATNLIETNSLAMTNGGFDEATWGKLNVNDWQGSIQDGVYQLTKYTGDFSHIIVPNEADFEQAGKSTNGLQVGITCDTLSSIFSRNNHVQTTVAFSKTNNKKVKAIGTDWSKAFSEDHVSLSKFDGSNLDVSNVTNMSYMFSYNPISDLTSLANWDVSNVTNMDHMFEYNAISNLTPLANWNTSKVINTSWMFFYNAISDLTPLANWDVSKVTDMDHMFEYNAISDLTSLVNWDVSNVTNMSYMFSSNKASNLTPLANWDVSNVTTMECMFSDNPISNLDSLANWNTSKVTNMKRMFFYNAISDLTPLANWDVSKVTDMSWMFAYNPDIIDLRPIAYWDISSINNSFTDLFYGDTKLNLTNVNITPLMQDFLKKPNMLRGATFITNNADLVKVVVGKDLPNLTNTAKRTIIFNIPNAIPETIVQIINYKAITTVQVQFDFDSREIIQTYPVKNSDWQLDASNSNVTVNGQPSTEYQAYTLDPNDEDIDFAAIPIPKIPGYKAKILHIPSDNPAQPAMLLISFAALPSVNPGAQNAPDDTKQDQSAITDTKHLNTSNMQIVSNQPILVENVDNNLQTLDTDTNASTWQVEDSVADELITPYVVFNSNHKLHLPRFDNYNLQIIKRTSNKDDLSFVYLDQNKAFKYVFNIKIKDGKYLLSINEIENKRLIPVQQISFTDYYQLIKLIVKLINK